MKLIGMLDSPYVRRVAISLQCLGLRFEHEPLSVFRNFEQFQRINPVVKAPTLVCDDGRVLMESALIIEYAQRLASPRTLMPEGLEDFVQAQRVIGLALVACEKSVQILYERDLRPSDKRHEPWLERVSGQLLAAYAALEQEIVRRPPVVTSAAITQDTISTTVAWQFTQQLLPGIVPTATCPALAALSAQAEALPEFKAAPYGLGTYRHDKR